MDIHNILIVTMSMDIGGAETHILELAKSLKALNYNVFVVSNGGIYVNDLKKYGIPHYSLPLHNKNPLNMIKSYTGLKSIVKNNNIDIIHAHARIPSFLCAFVCRKFKIPLVTTAHGIYDTRFGLKYFSNWGIKTIAVSDDIKKYLIESYKIDPCDITVTVNGIDTDRFNKTEKNQKLISEFNLDAAARRILYLGRLDPDSGIYAFKLADAMIQIDRDFPGIEVLITGDGTLSDSLKKKADEINSLLKRRAVILIGARTDIPEIINICDVAVALSRAALESLSCLKPVVLAGNYGYLGLFREEILAECLKTNFTARGHDMPDDTVFISDLEKALSLTNEQIDVLSPLYRATVVRYYSIDAMSRDAVKTYQTALNQFKKNHKPYDFILLGYYGYNNSGDDALLYSIERSLLNKDPDLNLCVLSNLKGKQEFDEMVTVVHRFNLLSVIKSLRKSKVLVFGGGNIIQDVTSLKSLIYYIGILKLGMLLGLKTMLYSNGIGPVNTKTGRYLTAKVLNCVDIITLREQNSFDLLSSLGVSRPRIYLTADETLTLPLPDFKKALPLLKDAEIDISTPYLCVSVRNWPKNPPTFTSDLARVLDLVNDTYGYQVVLLPMQRPNDSSISREICSKMRNKSYILEGDFPSIDLIPVIMGAKMVLGMRLHSLIYAVGTCVPLYGIIYDPKVGSFLESARQAHFTKVGSFNYNEVSTGILSVLNDLENIREELKDGRDELTNKALQNSALAFELLTEAKKN